MSDFQLGDVVRLKSGGPDMTIQDNASAGGFICRWFNEKNEIQKNAFQNHELKKASPKNLKEFTDEELREIAKMSV